MKAERELRRYLRRATRGLWGKSHTVVWAELEGHIRMRAAELQITGLSEEAAILRALSELGSPSLVSHGMAHVYILPKALPLAAMCLCLFQ